MIFLITAATFLSTLLGGFVAFRLKDKLHLILGFSAGAVIGVAFFDLLPEALDLAGKSYSTSTVTSVIALGFLVYLVLDRSVFFHTHGEEEHDHHHRGRLGAVSLSVHSLLDGIGIGFAFQVSAVVGAVVALAVLAHDFSDGINTVSLVTRHGGERKEAFRWLLIDAVAPVVGVCITLFFQVSETTLGLLLALFAGFFLYIGASDLLPESHHAHPVWWTTVTTILGVLFLYVVISLAAV